MFLFLFVFSHFLVPRSYPRASSRRPPCSCPFGLRSDTARKTRRRRRTAIDPACNYTQWVRARTHTNMPNCRRRGARQAPIRLEEKEEEGKGEKAQAETG